MTINEKNFDNLMNETQENRELKEKYEVVNKELSAGFENYFQITALWWLNLKLNEKINFPLCSVDVFKNLEYQKKYFRVGKNKKSYLYLNSDGQEYKISIYLEEETKLQSLFDDELMKLLCRGIDAKNDPVVFDDDDPDRDRCLIHYIAEFNQHTENVLVSFSKR